MRQQILAWIRQMAGCRRLRMMSWAASIEVAAERGEVELVEDVESSGDAAERGGAIDGAMSTLEESSKRRKVTPG
eukprot:scaffold713_cov114-Isochrysis_galbana.AAC.8